MKNCNPKSTCIVGDCDNCTQIHCEKMVVCDICGAEIYDEYFEIENTDYCRDCLKDNFCITI